MSDRKLPMDRELADALKNAEPRWIVGCRDCNYSSAYLKLEAEADELLVPHSEHDTWKTETL